MLPAWQAEESLDASWSLMRYLRIRNHPSVGRYKIILHKNVITASNGIQWRTIKEEEWVIRSDKNPSINFDDRIAMRISSELLHRISCNDKILDQIP